MTQVAPFPIASPSSTPDAQKYGDVDDYIILTTLYPALRFSPRSEMFDVNEDPEWRMWINSRAEGHFTDMGGAELAVIVANEAPGRAVTPNDGAVPWGSYLAVLARNGSLHLVHRANLFPVSISPLSFDVKIERVIDYDHDDQDDLLVTTTATRLGFTTRAGFLYHWEDQSFSEVWSASLGEDNTAALNQAQYYSSSAELRFVDIDGSGIVAIIVDMTRTDYAHGSQGLPDLDRPVARRLERKVYHWNGNAYIPDLKRTTPIAPISSPTP